MLISRVFRSLGKNEVPDDFKSLKRGETSSFNNLVEKFEVGAALVISSSFKRAFDHFALMKFFLFHLLLSANLSGFTVCVLSFSEANKDVLSKNER